MSSLTGNTPITFFSFFSVDFCRFCVVIRFFIPDTTANDFQLRRIHSRFFILQGNYRYHYDVFGITRSLTWRWTRYLPHSKPVLYHNYHCLSSVMCKNGLMIYQYVDNSSYICFKDDETELTAKCGHNILFTCKKPASEPWQNKSTILYIFLPTLGVHLYIQNSNLRLFEPFPSFRYQWSVQLKIFSSIY